MKTELDKQLCEKYPKIFNDRHGNMKTTAMCWGFECGDGWYNLIDLLCSLIAWDVKHNNCPEVTATQVKEKYGTLRFYYNGGNDVVDGYVRFAEQLSAFVCDVCGNPGKSSGGGWITTRCQEHDGNAEGNKDAATRLSAEIEQLQIKLPCGHRKIDDGS